MYINEDQTITKSQLKNETLLIFFVENNFY
jgi:hypothetical protein